MLIWSYTVLICWSGATLSAYVDLELHCSHMLIRSYTVRICLSGDTLFSYVDLELHCPHMLIWSYTVLICWSELHCPHMFENPCSPCRVTYKLMQNVLLLLSILRWYDTSMNDVYNYYDRNMNESSVFSTGTYSKCVSFVS